MRSHFLPIISRYQLKVDPDYKQKICYFTLFIPERSVRGDGWRVVSGALGISLRCGAVADHTEGKFPDFSGILTRYRPHQFCGVLLQRSSRGKLYPQFRYLRIKALGHLNPL